MSGEWCWLYAGWAHELGLVVVLLFPQLPQLALQSFAGFVPESPGSPVVQIKACLAIKPLVECFHSLLLCNHLSMMREKSGRILLWIGRYLVLRSTPGAAVSQ